MKRGAINEKQEGNQKPIQKSDVFSPKDDTKLNPPQTRTTEIRGKKAYKKGHKSYAPSSRGGGFYERMGEN